MDEPSHNKKKRLGQSRHTKTASEARSLGMGFAARLLAELFVRIGIRLMESDWFNQI